MIKVNLLPQRKAKRAAADPSSKVIALGAIGLAAAAAMVFLLVDMPKRSRLGELREANDQLQAQIADKTRQLIGYEELKKAIEEEKKRADAINRLNATKVVPAHVLHELGKVLMREGPTMTEAMAKLVKGDSNKGFITDWDPSHVWMSGFADTAGTFKLEGGAQSESDVTQLAKRLAASVYFMNVTPAGGERVKDRESGLAYYKFTITGKVAY